MRQAGRYLPEYRAVREKIGDFLKLCFTPELAAEVTLQPVRRFGFDAAILFSDILVVPYALGQPVQFALGEGPQLDAIADRRGLARLKAEVDHGVLAPIYETIKRVKEDLPRDVALLGFCGAPWTVASYMVAGGGTSEQEPARRFAYGDPDLRYVKEVPVDAVGLDWTVDLAFARDQIQCRVPVQGNLDPLVLLAGGGALDRAVDNILEAFSERPFIFNLGHGILPQTPIAHVEQMLARVRGT